MLIKQNGKYGAMVGNIRVFTMERAVEVYKMFAARCYADLTMEASVVLSDQFMSCDTSAARAGSAVRSIAATLCDLSGVTAVRLSVIGESGLTYYDISEPITPQPAWFSE